MKITWISDTHIDALTKDKAREFYDRLLAENSDAILITGDISNSKNLLFDLKDFEALQKPIYFVLGNHDFWYGNIDPLRKSITELSHKSKFLNYLTSSSYIKINNSALIGHDGWYDAINGSYKKSLVQMTDWMLTGDFINTDSMYFDLQYIVNVCRKLSAQAALHIRKCVEHAIKDGISHILIATHVPPFVKATIYEGKISSPPYLCWFSSGILGKTLTDLADKNPDIKFDIYAGHTHNKADVVITKNMECHVAYAKYTEINIDTIIV